MTNCVKFSHWVSSYRNGFGRRPGAGESGPIVLRIADVSSGRVDLSNPRRGSVSAKEAETYKLQTGDLLFIRVNGARDIVGRCCVVGPEVPPDTIFNDHLIRVRLAPGVDPEFARLCANLPAARSLIEEAASTSAGQLTISQQVFESIDVPDLPLSEQRQIAARLKAQLAEVDKARQAAEAQLRDAHTLHATVLKETFLNGASKNWPKIELGAVGEVFAGVTLGRKTNGKSTRTIPYLRVANVKDGHLDLSDISTIEATEAEIERLLLQPGDILLTEGGDPDKLGRGTFWSGELDECIHQNHIFRVRFPSDSYLPEFIAAQIGSTYGKGYFFAHAKKTTGIATINQKVLKSFPVLSPTIEVQRGIISAINSQLDEVGKIIQSAKKQLADITLLPQKILAQAFGEARP